MKKISLTILIALTAQVIFAADSYYFQRAEEAYNNKDLDLCLHYCKEGVGKNPKDGKCWAVIAEIYSKREYARYGEAMEAAEKALTTLSKKDKYWIAFVHGIRGDVFYKVENLQASKESYMIALSMQPENTTYIYDLADVCYRLGEYDESIKYYQRYIDLSPNTIYIYGELAYVYYKAGKKAEAQRYCDLTNALGQGGNTTAHRVLSMMAVDRGDYVEACREAAQAMFIRKSWYEEGDTLKVLCPDLLMAAIRTEVAKAQKDAETNATAAYCAFTMNRYWDALYYLHRKMEQSDAPQSVYPELASVYQRVEALDEAEKYYLLTLKTDSGEYVWRGLAQVARYRGRFLQANQYLRRAMEKNPAEGKLYYLIARNLYQAGLPKEALMTFDTAQVLIEEEDWQLSIMANQAEIYRELGQEKKAEEILAQAQKLRKEDEHREEFFRLDALLGDTAALARHAEYMRANKQETMNSEWGSLAGAYAILKDKEHTLECIRLNEETGEHMIAFLSKIKCYAFLKDDPDFKAMLAYYAERYARDLAELRERLGESETNLNAVTELPFTQQGGVNRVQCTINGLPLYFVFDTGAADVSISSVEANFMLKNGYLTNADFMGKQNFVTATGEIHEGTVINLRELRVGDVILKDIKASVIKNQSAPLLLGQSCFRRFGIVEVDNKAQVIRLLAK
jgi:clan AA aspartic protease (TIGR02281 family)